MQHRSKKTIYIITVLILLSVSALALTSYTVNRLGYIKFVIEVYDENGRLITDVLGRPTIPDNIKVYAQVYAIMPPNSGDVMTEIYRGEVKGRSLVLEAKGNLSKVAQAWAKFEGVKEVKPGYSSTSLELNLWLVDSKTYKVIQRVSYFYPYDPQELLNGKKWEYTVKIAINTTKTRAESGTVVEPQQGCMYYYVWELNSTVTPEADLSAFGQDNVKYYEGAWYVKIPILSIHNNYTLSGEVDAAIGLVFEKKTEFKAAIGIGVEVAKKLKGGDITGGLNKKVYLGGVTRSVFTDSFWVPDSVSANEWAYVWIWARPVMEFYNEYLVVACPPSYIYRHYTGNDKVEFFVQDIVTEYEGVINGRDVYRIVGGIAYEPPPSYITSWLFNITLSNYRYVTYLDPGQGHNFRVIIPNAIDTCSADFEVSLGIPLAVVLTAIGMPEFAPLAVMMAPSLSYGESETVYISGGVQNDGPYTEYLYLRISELQYKKDPPWWKFWEDPCYYRVPVSMYIESR